MELGTDIPFALEGHRRLISYVEVNKASCKEILLLSAFVQQELEHGLKQTVINCKRAIEFMQACNTVSLELNKLGPTALKYTMLVLLRLGAVQDTFIPKETSYLEDQYVRVFVSLYKQVYTQVAVQSADFFGEAIHKLSRDDTFFFILVEFARYFNESHSQLFNRLAFIEHRTLTTIIEGSPCAVCRGDLEGLFDALCMYYSHTILHNKQCSGSRILSLMDFLARRYNFRQGIVFVKSIAREHARRYYTKMFKQESVTVVVEYLNKRIIRGYERQLEEFAREKGEQLMNDCIYEYPALLDTNYKLELLRTNPLSFDTTEFLVDRAEASSDVLSHFYQYYPGIEPVSDNKYHSFPLENVQLVLHQRICINFRNEDGVDAGGLSREVFSVLISQLVKDSYWLFRPLNGFYYPDVTTRNDESQLVQDLTFVGAILGICLLNGFLIDDYFPDVFYYLLLHDEITDEKLAEMAQEVDKELMDNMYKLKGMKGMDGLEDILCQNFTLQLKEFDWIETIPLCHGGENIYVNSDNVSEYVRLRLRATFYGDKHKFMFGCMRNGLRLVIFDFKLRLLNHHELRYFLCGDAVDLMSLQRTVTYVPPYNERHETVVWFWEVLGELNKQERQNFLKFMFSTPRIPPLGFEKFEIQKGGEVGGYPVSHTCSGTLDLPEYQDKHELRAKLGFSIQFCEGFGII